MSLRQPQTPRRFNRDNFYGRVAHAVIMPAWDHFQVVSAGTEIGGLNAYGPNGQSRYYFDALDTGTSSVIDKKVELCGRWGPCVAAVNDNSASNNGAHFHNPTADFGFFEPGQRNITGVTLYRPVGNGSAGGTADPRLFSKDSGTAEGDHDFMMGGLSGGSPRTRIRIGGATKSVVNTLNVQNDALNLIAGGVVEINTTEVKTFISHIREDGQSEWDVSTTAETGGYSPRNTTTMGVFSNAGGVDNFYIGEIIAIFFFDAAIFEPAHLLPLMYDPWQVFEKRSIRPYYDAAVLGGSAIFPPLQGKIIRAASRHL